mgnify:CR=1 FL=1
MARDEELKKRWEEVVEKLSAQFADGDPLDLDGIIYLIGVQELGQLQIVLVTLVLLLKLLQLKIT